jgi:hypothetical protein
MTGIVAHFRLTDPLFFPTLGSKVMSFVSSISELRLRFCHGQRAQERNHDGGGDVPLFEDHPADTLPLLTKSQDSRLQAWERMAICTFGSRTVDSRPHPKSSRLIRETVQ